MATSADPSRTVHVSRTVQIDVVRLSEPPGFVTCNLYTPDRCVKLFMPTHEYEALVRDGFFIRDGQVPDSANVYNTTLLYAEMTRL